MNHDDLFDNVCSYYEYFIRKVSGYNDFEFDPNDRQCTLIINYCVAITNNDKIRVGPYLLYYYFLLQFSHWDDKYTRANKIYNIAWILGNKAIERWRNRSMEYYSYHCDTFASKYRIRRSDLYNRKNNDIFNTDITERSRYHNTEQGLVHCIENSLSYKSTKVCITCKFNRQCKRLSLNAQSVETQQL